MLDWGGKPEARLILGPEKLPLPNAAFVNSAAIHALDFDDIYTPGTLHLNCMIVPVILAVAEKVDADGRAALNALILGYEMAGAIGRTEKSYRRGQGFLPSSLAGSFGATLSAAYLLGLTSEQTTHALGINYAQISGNRQALLDASLTKRLQPAFAVRSALWSAALAKRGITGPLRILEGDAGYFSLYLNGKTPPLSELIDLPTQFAVEQSSIKRYPSCGACHSVQIAAERLYEEVGIPPKDIERVETVGIPPIVSEPFRLGENPQVNAQFSGAWAVAHTLLRGPATVSNYTDKSIRADKEVHDLAQSIQAISEPPDLPPPAKLSAPDDREAYYRYRHQGVIVYTRNGQRHARYQAPAHTYPPSIGSWATTEKKFYDCANFAGIESEEVDRISQMIRDLENQGNISDLYPRF